MKNYDKNLDLFLDTLRQANSRITAGRVEMFRLFQAAGSPLSAQEIVKNQSGTHFATVYRNIDTFLKLGIIKLVPQGFMNKYELKRPFQPHHHHITCESCHKSFEIKDKSIEQKLKKLTLQAGLLPTEHTFELYGICRRCQKA